MIKEPIEKKEYVIQHFEPYKTLPCNWLHDCCVQVKTPPLGYHRETAVSTFPWRVVEISTRCIVFFREVGCGRQWLSWFRFLCHRFWLVHLIPDVVQNFLLSEMLNRIFVFFVCFFYSTYNKMQCKIFHNC